MKINKKLIKYNFTKGRAGLKIEYIVIHDTGNTGKGAGANNHFLYFNGGNRQASAHYFVDSKEILQVIEDSNTAWHCGDTQKYTNGGATLKNIAKNSNSIGIEICINSDGDYSKSVANTIELTAHLMKLYNVPLNKVIRHHDVSGKLCPNTMSKNNWEAWRAFKIALEREASKSPGIKVNIKGKVYVMEGVFQNDKNYVGIRELAETLGHKVDWDQINKVVVIK